MAQAPKGELVPHGGGDPIPLIRDSLTVGRRESCDVCLRFPNVSGVHCELKFREGYWYIKDRGSTNGVKVNGIRVQEKILKPKDEVTIAKRHYVIEYVVAEGTPAPKDLTQDEVMGQSLMERAGLVARSQQDTPIHDFMAEMEIEWEKDKK